MPLCQSYQLRGNAKGSSIPLRQQPTVVMNCVNYIAGCRPKGADSPLLSR
jgi:hypothetical protein